MILVELGPLIRNGSRIIPRTMLFRPLVLLPCLGPMCRPYAIALHHCIVVQPSTTGEMLSRSSRLSIV